jgi:hypothetical protein
MINIFKRKKIVIESDRDSVSAGDDMSRHNKFSEFYENTKMLNLIEELLKIHSIGNHWAIWAGTYDNYKCIRDNNGNWLTSKRTKIKVFFKDIEKFVFFDSEFSGVKCRKN